MFTIAHISDLHFGRAHPLAAGALETSLAAAGADLVIISGDITQAGRRSEYAQAGRFLSRLSQPYLAVPGNHDAPVYHPAERLAFPWRRFERHVGATEPRVVRPAPGLAVIGVNTARRAAPRLNWAFGRISDRSIDAADAMARERRAAGDFVMLACHHPFVVSPNRAGSEIVRNGARALERFADAGVRLIFTGHTHLSAAAPIAATDARILSVQAGTAMSTRMRGDGAAYNTVRLMRTEAAALRLDLDIMRWNGESFAKAHTTRFAFNGERWRVEE